MIKDQIAFMVDDLDWDSLSIMLGDIYSIAYHTAPREKRQEARKLVQLAFKLAYEQGRMDALYKYSEKVQDIGFDMLMEATDVAMGNE